MPVFTLGASELGPHPAGDFIIGIDGPQDAETGYTLQEMTVGDGGDYVPVGDPIVVTVEDGAVIQDAKDILVSGGEVDYYTPNNQNQNQDQHQDQEDQPACLASHEVEHEVEPLPPAGGGN